MASSKLLPQRRDSPEKHPFTLLCPRFAAAQSLSIQLRLFNAFLQEQRPFISRTCYVGAMLSCYFGPLRRLTQETHFDAIPKAPLGEKVAKAVQAFGEAHIQSFYDLEI